MTTATRQKTTPPSATLRKLEQKRDELHRKAREAREQRDAYDTETEAMRRELTDRRETHSEEYAGAEKRVVEGTEAAKLSAEIRKRMNGTNPHEGDYIAARDRFHEADAAVAAFQADNLEARLAEFEPDADAGIEAIREGLEALLRGCEQYAVAREEVLGVILSTPRLDGQALADDPRVGEWAKLAREVLNGEIAKPGPTPNARLKVS